MRRCLSISLLALCGFANGVVAHAQVQPIHHLVRPHNGSAECHTSICKECIAEPTKKEVKQTIYSAKPVDFCVKECTRPSFLDMLRRLFHRDGSVYCGCPACGHVRTKTVLLKKTIKCGEEHGYECKVIERPIECQPPVTTIHHRPSFNLAVPPPIDHGEYQQVFTPQRKQ